jgi:CcmD family protein
MENIHYMFLAFLITWLVIAGYLWSLGRQVQNLREEMRVLRDEEPTDRVE